MFIEDWNSFYEQAEQLYRNDPLRTRYVTKYKHTSGKLILKVTDDRVCLQYKTDQQSDLKKVEKLNNLFFSLMAASSHADAADPSGEAATAVDGDSDTAMEDAAPTASSQLKQSGSSNHASTNHSRQSQSASRRGRSSRRQKG